jgi:transposase-like protein
MYAHRNCHARQPVTWEIYGIERSPALISNVNENLMEEGRGPARPAARQSADPIVYLDAPVVKMREKSTVHNLAGYVSNEITMESNKEMLG